MLSQSQHVNAAIIQILYNLFVARRKIAVTIAPCEEAFKALSLMPFYVTVATGIEQ